MNTRAAWSYDAIAAVYATDMGQSMPFDDIGYYRALALKATGPVLELGCGSGRILLPLLRAGVAIQGVDRSLPMLRQLRTDGADLDPRVAQMDLRALALRGRQRLILAPYSLITYVTRAADVDAVLEQLGALLDTQGALLLDAFIPRPVDSFEDFRRDYLRPHGSGHLERAKRIRQLADGCNRIERRYRLLGADGELQQEFTTLEVIRPYPPEHLRGLLARHGYRISQQDYDYGTAASADNARFYSVLGTRAHAA